MGHAWSSVCCGSAMDSRSGPSIESGSGEDAWDIITKIMVTCLQMRLMRTVDNYVFYNSSDGQNHGCAVAEGGQVTAMTSG